jgi:hypothetical protein
VRAVTYENRVLSINAKSISGKHSANTNTSFPFQQNSH